MHHWEQTSTTHDCVGESQKYCAEQKKSCFIYIKSKVQPDLTYVVVSWESGYKGLGQQLEGDKCDCWDACDLFCDPGADLTLCESQVSFILLMCTFFCMVYFSKNFTLSPYTQKNFGIHIISLIHHQESVWHNGKICGMFWILILLKLTFAPTLSAKINSSILKVFAQETNVFDEKTKK